MGGIAGQALAAAKGDRIEKLILVGTGARIVGVKPEFRRGTRRLDRRRRGRPHSPSGWSITARPAAGRSGGVQTFVDMVANANKAFMDTVLTNAFALDLRPVLPRITASTLVVRAANSTPPALRPM